MDLLLDCETLGLTHNAVVIQIAYLSFDMNRVNTIAELRQGVRSINLPIGPQLMQGRVIDTETVAWWRKQSVEAQGKAFDSVYDDLSQVQNAINTANRVWSRGYIDMLWLQDLGVKIHYQRIRDTRTWIHDLQLERPAEMVPHDAEWDVVWEAYQVQRRAE